MNLLPGSTGAISYAMLLWVGVRSMGAQHSFAACREGTTAVTKEADVVTSINISTTWRALFC